DSLVELASSCPENFQCMSLLVSAELHRLQGQLDEAVQLCEQAIEYARDTGNLQQQALAFELAAKIWLGRRLESSAAASRPPAHRSYAMWGATAKVRDLESRYGNLLASPQRSPAGADLITARPSGLTDAYSLDMATVLKVARAIAIEIELDELLRKLMKLALENGGAGAGVYQQ